MKRGSLTGLGETEMEVLHHVWTLETATVADVRECILKDRDVAYTTVMTVMKNLTDKGLLEYVRDGRTYVYYAARPPEDVRGGLLRGLVEKVFGGSPAALVQTLVRDQALSPEEREAVRRIIERMEDADDD